MNKEKDMQTNIAMMMANIVAVWNGVYKSDTVLSSTLLSFTPRIKEALEKCASQGVLDWIPETGAVHFRRVFHAVTDAERRNFG